MVIVNDKAELMVLSALIGLLWKTMLPFVIALLIVMSCDYLTGIIRSVLKGTYKAKIAIRGILKKFGYILIIVAAAGVDITLYYQTGLAVPVFYVSNTLAVWFTVNDFISIMVNLESLGVKMPKFLREYLQKINKD